MFYVSLCVLCVVFCVVCFAFCGGCSLHCVLWCIVMCGCKLACNVCDDGPCPVCSECVCIVSHGGCVL